MAKMVPGFASDPVYSHRLNGFQYKRLHGSTCALTTDVAFDKAFRTLEVLRLLGVQTNCLIETTSLEKYVALSYVWGLSFKLPLNYDKPASTSN